MNDQLAANLLAANFQTESIHLLNESFAKIRHCVGQLNEEQVWFRPERSLNSIGNLLLHLCGNLNQWVTCGVGGKTDERDREREFSADGTHSADELIKLVEQAIAAATTTIKGIDEQSLLESRSIQGFRVSGMGAIMHSVPHFVGHTHQVIYLTRLILRDNYQFQWSPDADRGRVPI